MNQFSEHRIENAGGQYPPTNIWYPRQVSVREKQGGCFDQTFTVRENLESQVHLLWANHLSLDLKAIFDSVDHAIF